MKDWKSTVSGILTGLIGTLSSIMAFQVPAALLNPQQARTWLYVTVGCNLGAIIAKVWLGVITNNADAGAAALALNQLAASPGTGTPFVAADLAETPKPPVVTPAAVVALLILLTLPALLIGCSNFERNAFNTLSASQAVIVQARTDYVSGKITQTTCTDVIITDATEAHNVAVTALEVYDAEKAAGTDVAAQGVAVTGDVASVVTLAAEIKTLYTNPSGCKLP